MLNCISAIDFAHMIGVSKNTVYRKLENGELKGFIDSKSNLTYVDISDMDLQRQDVIVYVRGRNESQIQDRINRVQDFCKTCFFDIAEIISETDYKASKFGRLIDEARKFKCKTIVICGKYKIEKSLIYMIKQTAKLMGIKVVILGR